MRLSEALDGVGRPIAYLPELAKFLGGVKVGVLFCQLFYWSERADESGWFWKSQQGLADETGLTIDELRAARKELAEKGVVQCRYARIEHRLYFKIDRQRLDALWLRRNGHVGKFDMASREILDGDKVEVDLGSDRETTAQITNLEGERDNVSRKPTFTSKGGHQKPRSAWPENLELTPEMASYAEARGVNARNEFRKWRDYCAKKGERNSDWDAAWRIWIERALEFIKRDATDGERDESPEAARRRRLPKGMRELADAEKEALRREGVASDRGADEGKGELVQTTGRRVDEGGVG
jgi:hypothetical protein